MIAPTCNKCGAELTQPGALIFSPPTLIAQSPDRVFKFHICTDCWQDIKTWLKTNLKGSKI